MCSRFRGSWAWQLRPKQPNIERPASVRYSSSNGGSRVGTCSLTASYRLGQKAELARQVLARFPECKSAWGALARFYRNEAEVSAALDILSFEKCGPWLDQPIRREALAASFEDVFTRGGDGGNGNARS
jgi:hypothetical protein